MRVKSFLTHLWLVFTDIAASTPVAIANPLRLPRKPPPPSKNPTNSPASTSPPLSCNLVVPTAKSWEDNKDDIGEFARMHWVRYLEDPSYKTFPLYLRGHFARDLAPSSLFCDTVGTCRFTCQALNPELSPHDKQMAYYVFEQIAGVDHLFKTQRIGMQEAASYVDGKTPELIRTYSAAPRIQRQLQKKLDDRRRNEKLGMAVASGLLMLAGGAVAVPGVLSLEETIVAPLTNTMTSTHISIVGTINAVRREPEYFTSDLEENIRGSLNDFRHIMISNLTYDMKMFMEGDKNHFEQDLIGILKGDYFFRRDENIQPAILKMSKEMMFSSVMNGLWAQERSYIVWADAPFRGCQYDTRGPSENRVCFAEDPKSDWENFCSHNGHCKGDNDIGWHSRFEKLRKEGDPRIPKGLKHPFKMCKQKTEHGVGEPWHDFDENPPLR